MRPTRKRKNELADAGPRVKARALRAEDIAVEIENQLGEASLDLIYRDRVLTDRTRRYELKAPKRSTRIEVLHTLLGIELKIGNRRLLCPDLATARYLSVFARLGCDWIALPYDITQISRIADELESGWHRAVLLVDHFTANRSSALKAAVRRLVIGRTRERINDLGAGSPYPEFTIKRRRK